MGPNEQSNWTVKVDGKSGRTILSGWPILNWCVLFMCRKNSIQASRPPTNFWEQNKHISSNDSFLSSSWYWIIRSRRTLKYILTLNARTRGIRTIESGTSGKVGLTCGAVPGLLYLLVKNHSRKNNNLVQRDRSDLSLSLSDGNFSKVKCVFPVVISSEFRMSLHRDGDHQEDAPHCIARTCSWILFFYNVAIPW